MHTAAHSRLQPSWYAKQCQVGLFLAGARVIRFVGARHRSSKEDKSNVSSCGSDQPTLDVIKKRKKKKTLQQSKGTTPFPSPVPAGTQLEQNAHVLTVASRNFDQRARHGRCHC